MIDIQSLVGRYYTDLSPAEQAALPVGTVLADAHPDFTLPDMVKGKRNVWRFTDGSLCENWDAHEVVKSVPNV